MFARTLKQLEPLTNALHDTGLVTHALADDDEATSAAGILLGSMHRAKGLEFRAVLVLGCGERYLPHPAALRDLTDPSDREQALAGERQLLYVAMTRARERLHITCAGEPSPHRFSA